MPTTTPRPGQAWSVINPAGAQDCAVYLGRNVWNLLVLRSGEPDLTQVSGLEPIELLPQQPAGFGFAEHFDALAAHKELGTTWSQLVQQYQQEALLAVSPSGER